MKKYWILFLLILFGHVPATNAVNIRGHVDAVNGEKITIRFDGDNFGSVGDVAEVTFIMIDGNERVIGKWKIESSQGRLAVAGPLDIFEAPGVGQSVVVQSSGQGVKKPQAGEQPGGQDLKPEDKPDTNIGINPKDPIITALIKEWLNRAEPPINATDGANTKYEPWGRFVGTTNSAVIKATRKPDDVAGRIPEQYVWDKRDTLDSVDHCTLGEYVTAKLGNKSIDHCRERYKPKVSDVVGMSKEQAEKKLSGMGLKTKIGLGNPAATEKDSLTVEKTIPKSGSTVDRGSMVTLVIHPPYVDKRTVPEFRGLTAKEVIDKIKAAGLNPEINTVKSTSAEQTGKVAALDPPPGSEVVAGTTVFVDAFLPFVDKRTVPEFTGLTAKEVVEKIKAAGLNPEIKTVKATSAEQTGKVAALDPPPGSEVVAGATVFVDAFLPFVKAGKVPNVVGFSVDKAADVIKRAGFKPDFTDDNTEERCKDKTVTRQEPKAETKVVSGAQVNMFVCSYVAPDTPDNSKSSKQTQDVNGTIWDWWGPIPYGYGTKCLTEDEVSVYMKPGAKKDKKGWFARKKGGSMKPTGKSCKKPVESQKPSEGKAVYSDTVESFNGNKSANTIKVPDVTGLGVRKAADVVKVAGLTPAFELGADTKDPQKDKTVARQVPEPGIEIASGSEVKMFIYTLKSESKTIPNLVGMPIARAKTILEEMGLSMAPELGEDASRAGDVGRVYKQIPESGSEVTAGGAVNVWVYGEYPSPKPVAVVPPPTTEKPDNDQGSKTVFVLDRVEFNKHQTKTDLCGDNPKCRHDKTKTREVYYSISEDEAKYQFIQFRGTNKESDFMITFNFDRPPSRVNLGGKLYLNSAAAATGFTTGYGLKRSFRYYIKKDGGRSPQYVDEGTISMSNTELPLVGKRRQGRLSKKSVSEISIPENVNKELIIGGKHGWDPGLSVEWVYKPVAGAKDSVQSKTIPNLVGMPIAKAKTILQEMGLSMTPELGDDAAKANDAGRVYKQSPESGSAATNDVAVTVWVYGEYEEQKKTNIPDAGVPFVDIPLSYRGKPFDRVELWHDSQELEILTKTKGRIIRPEKGFLHDKAGYRTFTIYYWNKGDEERYLLQATWLEPNDPIVDSYMVKNYICKGKNGVTVYEPLTFDYSYVYVHSNKKAVILNTTAPQNATSSEIDQFVPFLNMIGEYIEPYAKSCK